MAIGTPSRKYTDNLRKKKRFLQGKGVNLRETIVTGSVYAEDRITVPGLHDDDPIISVIDMDDVDDVTGYLDDDGDEALLDVFSGNKGITFTARKGGAAGNKVYVKAAADPSPSAPLSVVIGAYDVVLGTTGNPGKTAILVNLATDSGGVALTTSVNSAANVRAAVLDNQAAAKVVDAALDGTGATAWTATGPTPLAGGTDFKQGPSTAHFDTAISGANNDVRYSARKSGAAGNSITVDYVLGGALAVDVTGTDIVVTVIDLVTTARQVVDAVNGKPAASALVIASPAPGNDGTGIVANIAKTNLSGGVDPGLRLTVASGGKRLKVLWLTSDDRDEN